MLDITLNSMYRLILVPIIKNLQLCSYRKCFDGNVSAVTSKNVYVSVTNTYGSSSGLIINSLFFKTALLVVRSIYAYKTF